MPLVKRHSKRCGIRSIKGGGGRQGLAGQCELWGAAGLQKIIYPPGKRPDGFEDMKERYWVNTGRIDQETVDYYRMIGVEMDLIEK